MNLRKTIVLLFIACLLHSCNISKHRDKKLEEQANHIIQMLDTTSIQFLNDWNYTQRGEANFWSRISGDSSIFNCSFYPVVDTPELKIYQVDKFLNYFKSTLKIDTVYYQIQLTKKSDTDLNIVGINNNGQDISLFENLPFDKIFPEQNPFDLLAKLTKLKDEINVIGISHSNVEKGLVQFYLPGGQHILTFIPEAILNSGKLEKFWKDEFSKGKQLNQNWNFRKLENPIDRN